MRNKHANRGGVNGSAKRANSVFNRRSKGSANAHMGYDESREHHPQSMQRQGQALRDYQSQQAGSSHAQREAQLRSITAECLAKALPKGQFIHATLSRQQFPSQQRTG